MVYVVQVNAWFASLQKGSAGILLRGTYPSLYWKSYVTFKDW